MVRRLLFMVPVAFALLTGTAGAAPLDKSANEKIDQAINEHYLATDFRKAEAVLLGVVKACGTQCSPAVLARAWMYVGVVRGSGNQDLAGAREAFNTAVGQDPAVKLDSALSTPETVEVFNQAKSGGGSTPPAAAEPAEAAGGGVVTMDCTPAVREVQTNRPIPVSCTSPAGASTLELAYRNGPNAAYATVLFSRSGALLAATIPCEATATAGPLHVYVVASSGSGELVGQWGTPDGPVVINLVENTKQAPPALPGQEPPERCGEGGTEPAGPAIEATGSKTNVDCPPGFPGCSGGGAWGDSCTPAEPCKDGLICLEGACENAASCESDSDCESGTCSEDGFCQSEGEGAGGSGPYPKNWVGAHFGIDLPILSGDSVCFRQGGWNDGFRCYDGNQLIESSDIWSTGASGGAVVGTMRAMLSYDRFFSPNLAAGARAGFAFGGGKADFNPVHLELRGSYWFVGINKLGINPYVFVGGGMGQVNGKEKAKVCQWGTDVTTGAQGCTAAAREVDAYKLMGLGFAEVGGGALFGITGNGGVLVNVAAMYMFPFPGINFQPSLGYMMGF